MADRERNGEVEAGHLGLESTMILIRGKAQASKQDELGIKILSLSLTHIHAQ